MLKINKLLYSFFVFLTIFTIFVPTNSNVNAEEKSVDKKTKVTTKAGGVGHSIADTFPDENMQKAVAAFFTGDKTNINHIITEGNYEIMGMPKDMWEDLMLHPFVVQNIKSVEGIQHFPNMKYLDISNNEISNIEPLSELTNLEDLALVNNQITNIEPLSELINLSELSLGINKISNIDCLSELTNLEMLDLKNFDHDGFLSKNTISNVEPLSGLTKLRSLYLGGNQISNIEPLSGLTGLVKLDLVDQIITNEEVLSEGTLVIENIVKSTDGTLISPKSITNNGIYENPNIIWTGLTSNVIEVSYDFETDVTIGSKTYYFSGKVVQPVTVTGKNINDLEIADISSVVYRGVNEAPHTPDVTITDGEYILEKDTDYILSYVNNINAGTATITITGIGEYSGEITKTFIITKRTLNALHSKGSTKIYDGSTSDRLLYIIPGIYTEGNNWIDSDGLDNIQISYTGEQLTEYPSANVGNYGDLDIDWSQRDFYISGGSVAENYQLKDGVIPGTHGNSTITPVMPTLNTPPSINNVFVGTSLSDIELNDKGGIVDGVQNEHVTETNIEGTYTWKNPNTVLSESGNYEVVFTPTGYNIDISKTESNYKPITFEVQVEVGTKNISDLEIADIPSVVYRGVNEEPHTPNVEITDGEYTLEEDIDYMLSYENNVNAGTASVTITGIEKYTGEQIVQFTINKKKITELISDEESRDKTYDGSIQDLGIIWNPLDGFVTSDNIDDLELTYTGDQTKYPSANVGIYWITFNAKNDIHISGGSLANNYKLELEYPYMAIGTSICPATPIVNTLPTIDTVSVGTSLSDIELNGKGGIIDGVQNEYVTETNIEGTYTWKNPNTVLSESGNYEVVFTPTGYNIDISKTESNYKSITFEVHVEVEDTIDPDVNESIEADNVVININALSGANFLELSNAKGLDLNTDTEINVFIKDDATIKAELGKHELVLTTAKGTEKTIFVYVFDETTIVSNKYILYASNFEITFDDKHTLNTDSAKTYASAVAYEIESSKDVTKDIVIYQKELNKIITSETHGTHDLTFTIATRERVVASKTIKVNVTKQDTTDPTAPEEPNTTNPPTDGNDKLPETGDDTNSLLYGILACISGLLAIGYVFINKKQLKL